MARAQTAPPRGQQPAGSSSGSHNVSATHHSANIDVEVTYFGKDDCTIRYMNEYMKVPYDVLQFSMGNKRFESTKLRKSATEEKEFNDITLRNETRVKITCVSDGFAMVYTADENNQINNPSVNGWIRLTNLR